jgi:hypothetical protein
MEFRLFHQNLCCCQNSTDVMFIIHFTSLKNGNDSKAKAALFYYLSHSQENTLEKHDFIAQGMNF